ncbi:hypothetical protein Pla175_22230 [Pirellulimonas nuda]|uniref:Arabinogalactan endo-beta-1,4-galactanase n=1 Tax=Pirellulimonas nuda TaxID=2528009 RepID=A0A518DBI9_9BACT|nr:hypothetical protein [Pirellulimonas nuda]QDU88839.1 hypothetical protein Pla175_22230 [Pirellulimonas nuda]
METRRSYPRRGRRARLLTAVRLAIVLAAGQAAARPAALNSAVLIYDQKTLASAPEVLARIAAQGERRVMFVVTVHCRLSPDLKPTALGLMRDRYQSWQDPANFIPLDDENLAGYRESLTRALRKANDLGMDVAILPHFDPAGEVTEWRNRYDFDPLADIGGYTYAGALIETCLLALEEGCDASTRIDFSLGGEMGHSVFAYPSSYLELARRVRARLAGRPVRIGVSLNHSDVADGLKASAEHQAELRGLFDACDFLGFSNYSPFPPPPRSGQFSEACRRFLEEMAKCGVRVGPDTPLQFSEIGLGGAPDRRGAATVDRAAAEPWEGTTQLAKNPWRAPDMIRLRRDYHSELLEFLTEQPGPRRVEAAYFWSEGSWDPIDVQASGFGDAEIQAAVRTHNAQAERPAAADR